MVKRCCMRPKFCNGEKLTVYRFPSEKTEADNRVKWIRVCKKIRKDLVVGEETVVCEAHWPLDYPKYRKKGHYRPIQPPSVFLNVPPCVIPPPPTPPRPTVASRTSNQLRNTLPDEIDEFEKLDRLSFPDFEQLLSNKRVLPVESTVFMNDGRLYVQSKSYFQGIPTFLIIVSNLLKFESFHLGVRVHIPFLSKHHVSCIDRWSVLDFTVCFPFSVKHLYLS